MKKIEKIIEMNEEHKKLIELRQDELNRMVVKQLNNTFKDFGVEIVRWEPLTKINDYERVVLYFKVKI
jgi:hypothetical protein